MRRVASSASLYAPYGAFTALCIAGDARSRRAADPASWQNYLTKMELMSDIDSSCNVPFAFDNFPTQETAYIHYDIPPKGNNTYEFIITAKDR